MSNFSSNALNPTTQAQEKNGAESLKERLQPVKGAVVAGEIHVNDAAGKSDVSAGTQVPEHNKHESCPTDSGFRLDFTNEGLLNGIILAEVLGKPKYFRKGRW